MAKKFRVYVSTPVKNLSARQKQFKTAILNRVVKAGLQPLGFYAPGMSEKIKFDFDGVSELMGLCQGALILAFSRWDATEIFDPPKQVPNKIISPTEYGHLEGGVAIAKSKPLLVIRDEEVAARGIVWDGLGRAILDIPREDTVSHWAKSSGFKATFNEWLKQVNEHYHVFLGYSSKAQPTADAINLYLTKLNIRVLDWREFPSGDSIIQEIERAAQLCTCGLFLFTKDDMLEAEKKTAGDGAAQTEPGVGAPRDNVVFEAGYFLSAKGMKRTQIILEKGAKFPVDLDGKIYIPLDNRNNISTIETKLRKYMDDVLGKDQ